MNNIKRIILSLIFSFLGFAGFSQTRETQAMKNITGVHMGILNVGIYEELGITNDFVLRGDFMFNSALWGGSFYPKTGFALYPTIGITPKYYYNFNRRLAKGKNIHNNSANYIAVDFSYTPNWFIISNEKNIEVSNFIRIIPSYGIRRNFAQNFNYEAKFGLGYGKNLDTRESSTVLQLGISIGYDF
ncbi:hypothetical protein HZQ44_06715 [Elizabethkingia anophelis]|nr:hypothetical protein [Elizabethkingia anophelis]MCT3694990.1 hypothetical protein [Elizabethkingia anophelis]MCT3858844.1 hypothetical protein [Elizabethkingia anophelis]MCT3912033.1 hypothetical protein [Elizabethkingia anophelis]MCT4311284.1 hypothetical protein [Elizabethkingia anophelis]